MTIRTANIIQHVSLIVAAFGFGLFCAGRIAATEPHSAGRLASAFGLGMCIGAAAMIATHLVIKFRRGGYDGGRCVWIGPYGVPVAS